MTRDEAHNDSRFVWGVRVFEDGQTILSRTARDEISSDSGMQFLADVDGRGITYQLNLYWRRSSETIPPQGGIALFRQYLNGNDNHMRYFVLSAYLRNRTIIRQHVDTSDYDIVMGLQSECTRPGQPYLVALDDSNLLVPSDQVPAGASTHTPTNLEQSARALKIQPYGSVPLTDITQAAATVFGRISIAEPYRLENVTFGLDIYVRPVGDRLIRTDSNKLMRNRYSLLNSYYSYQ